MLILTRRVGESVIIGDTVRVKVFGVHGDVVRLGIEAPQSVRIHREEVFQALKEANEKAAATSDAQVDELRGLLGRRTEPGAGR